MSKKPRGPLSRHKVVIIIGVVLGFSMLSTNLSMATGDFWRGSDAADKARSTSAPAPSSTPSKAQASATPSQTVDPKSAFGIALALDVDDSRITGYKRSAYGQAWKDVDHNGCDTRNDVLRRDSVKRHTKPGTHGCVMAKAKIRDDEYSYASPHTFTYERGDGKVEIDHVVSLHNAWQVMDDETQANREKFANDPENLEAVDSATNQGKSDKTIDRWRPDDKQDACFFAARVAHIKHRYDIPVTSKERTMLLTILDTDDCDGQSWSPDKATAFNWPKPKPIGEPKVQKRPRCVESNWKTKGCPGYVPPRAHRRTDPRFDYCYEANANGYGPYKKGRDPEYDWYRDRDGDGVVCET